MAIVFGLENLTFFWPRVTFLFLNVLREGAGGGGSTGSGIIPKNTDYFFLLPLVFNCTLYISNEDKEVFSFLQCLDKRFMALLAHLFTIQR